MRIGSLRSPPRGGDSQRRKYTYCISKEYCCNVRLFGTGAIYAPSGVVQAITRRKQFGFDENVAKSNFSQDHNPSVCSLHLFGRQRQRWDNSAPDQAEATASSSTMQEFKQRCQNIGGPPSVTRARWRTTTRATTSSSNELGEAHCQRGEAGGLEIFRGEGVAV